MTLYAPWACKAVVAERRALEIARDTRAGNLDNPTVMAQFNASYKAFEKALSAHITESNCEDMH